MKLPASSEAYFDQIHQLPGNEGIIFQITKGKTVDIRDPRIVVLIRSPTKEFCPVQDLFSYINFCETNKIVSSGDFLFRPTNPSQSGLVSTPFTSSAANARLKLYLKTLKIWEGETPHSTRSGCALTLSWLGIDDKRIKLHVGWKSDTMMQHYIAGNDFCNRKSAAKAISFCSNVDVSNLADKFDQYKQFKSFKGILSGN